MMNDEESVIGCMPIQLQSGHRRELETLVYGLEASVAEGATTANLKFTRFQGIINLYSEEPQLLDPILPQFVEHFLKCISWSSLPADSAVKLGSAEPPFSPLTHAAFKWLHTLTRVRGYAVIMRLLPHEVEYMSLLLSCLEWCASCENLTATNANAQLVFLLTAWLTMICKNPFNLAKFDSSRARNDASMPVSDRIIACMTRFQRHYYLRDEARVISTLLAQVLTRNSNNLNALLARVNEAINVIHDFQSEKDNGAVLISHLRLLAALFKRGKRKELRVCVTRLLDAALDRLMGVNCVNVLVRNLVVKLIQRAALVMLRPRLAEWRYRCGHRSLAESLQVRISSAQKSENNNATDAEYDDENNKSENSTVDDGDESDDEIPYELIEKLIGELLAKIYDRDGTVRWAAAKGVARICARLPRALAAEVVGAVIADSFNSSANGFEWQGGCLTLAELCRRGCLLPEQVPQVVSAVLPRALLFDEATGGSIGAGVRDAACYICWAFARGYEAHVIRDSLPRIAGALVCLALFDREVNIRRAASAAYQENVGRNGCFPHGIDILTIVDYAEVALIKHCYLDLAPRVAKYFEYRRILIDHLVDTKSVHCDESIRELSAEALEILTPLEVDYCREKLLPQLTERLNDKSALIKHGTLFAVAAILRGLHGAATSFSESAGTALINDRLFNNLECGRPLLNFIHINKFLIENHQIDGFGIYAKAFCRFIAAMCVVDAPLNDEQLIEYHNILDIVISDKNERLHPYARSAFEDLMKRYSNERFMILLRRIHDIYLPKLNKIQDQESSRLSAIVPLGEVPAEFLAAHDIEHDASPGIESGIHGDVTLADVLLAHLVDVIKDKSTPTWVFVRVAAIKCICEILAKFVQPNVRLSIIVETLIIASDDYTATVNGDVGRLARREAVLALSQILPITFDKLVRDGYMPHSFGRLLTDALCCIIRRCCEAIDKLRFTACTALGELLKSRSISSSSSSFSHHADQHIILPIPERELLNFIFIIDNNKLEEDQPHKSSLGQPDVENSEQPFKSIDWIHSKGYFRLRHLLASPIYGRSALEGFVLSAGSICAWTSENAFAAVALHLRTIKKDSVRLDSFISDLLVVYSRIIARRSSVAPILQFLMMLLNDCVFALLENDPDSSASFSELCQKVVKIVLSRNSPKVKKVACEVLGGLLQFNRSSKIFRNSVSTLISLLSSPYALLREKAMEQLLDALNIIDFDYVIGDSSDSKADNGIDYATQITSLLTSTSWSDASQGEILAAQKRLNELFIPTKTIIAASQNEDIGPQ